MQSTSLRRDFKRFNPVSLAFEIIRNEEQCSLKPYIVTFHRQFAEMFSRHP